MLSTFHMLVVIVDREAIVVREDRVVADPVAVVVVEAVAAAVVDVAVLVVDRAADARYSSSKKSATASAVAFVMPKRSLSRRAFGDEGF